ncbi:MAG TPA: RNA polymerase sigma factor [Blastocatellia bacterium]|nr:RNA polymerase sigma factor [Blastocatellia bacterium]
MANDTAQPPDEFLVVAAIVGDLEAFDELVRRYRAAVVRTAQSIVGREFAEDAAQDALLLAFKALPSIEDPTKFAAWLGVITRHHAYRFSKRERTRSAGNVEFDDVILEHVGALSRPLLEERERDEEIEKAFAALPADYATVLRLRFLDEMPLKRIAGFLGVPVSTVKWRVHRGKSLMREKLELLKQRGEIWNEITK